MIAADTSSIVAYLSGEKGRDVDLLDAVLESQGLLLPPVVLTELLSDPGLSKDVVRTLTGIPHWEVLPGFWERAGLLRAKILAKALKCRLGDALIAQICIDHDAPIITRDKDFRHFTQFGGLKVLP